MEYYDIAVHRWPMPWMSRFKVIEHFWSDDEKQSRLTLVTINGDSISFPRMDRRSVRIYANYKQFQEARKPKIQPTSDPVTAPAETAPAPIAPQEVTV